ncbi:MAG: ComF family protein [bacterium]|nr:ComF family protein [bacterium]
MNILDFLFPPRCLGCQKFGSFFCSSCRKKIVFVPQVCPVCEKPSVGGKTHLYCQTPYSLDGLVSFYAYEGPVRSALRRLKYKPFAFGGARGLVGPALDFVKENPAVFAPFLSFLSPLTHIIPVPLHSSRLRWRGFNQAKVLAEVFAKEWKSEIAELLIREKETSPQAGLDIKKRRENIVSAFSLNRRFVSNFDIRISNFIILDDIWTTGATLRAAGMVLKRAGAKTVWGLTLAR